MVNWTGIKGSLTIFANSLVIGKYSESEMLEIRHVEGKSFDGSQQIIRSFDGSTG